MSMLELLINFCLMQLLGDTKQYNAIELRRDLYCNFLRKHLVLLFESISWLRNTNTYKKKKEENRNNKLNHNKKVINNQLFKEVITLSPQAKNNLQSTNSGSKLF